MTSSDGTASYTYDATGQLIGASGNGKADSQDSEEACMSGGTWWISDEDGSWSAQRHYSGTCDASGTVYNSFGSALGDYQFSGTGSAEMQNDDDGRTVSSSSGASYSGYSMSDSQDVTSYDWDENRRYTSADPETPTETTAASSGWIHRADGSSSSYPPSSDSDYNPRRKSFVGVPEDIAKDSRYPDLDYMSFPVDYTLTDFSYSPSDLPWRPAQTLASSSSLSLVSSEEAGTNSLESAGTDSSAAASLSQSSLATISRTPSTFTESSVAGSLWRAASASFASSPVHTPPATLGAFASSFAADSLPSSFGPMSAESRISAVRAKLGGSASATSMSFAAVDSLFRLGSGSLDDATDSQSEIGVRHFDSAGRLSSIIDLNGGATRFTYDAAGNLASLTDPVQNTTTWTHDQQDRVTEETNQLGQSRSFAYDSSGNLAQYTDRDGRVRVYEYDSASGVASETWYATAEDAEEAENAENAIQYTRDSAGRITSESDAVSSVAYVYDSAGRLTSTTQSSVGGPTVTLAYQYDTAGHRTQMAATVDHPQAGTRADFVDDYAYDSLGRVVSVTEHGVTGGNAVAAKQIDLAYDTSGQIVSIDRYENGQLAVEGDYSYDSNGRLVGLVYHQGDTVLNSYAWTYSGDSSSSSSSLIPNPQSLIPSPWLPTGGLMPVHDTAGVTDALASGGLAGLDLLTGVTSSDGTASYTYDATGQLIGATYSANSQSLIANPSESFSYDANGNRTNAGYVVGAGNRLLSDGTYRYAYDAEGNRTAKFIDANEDSLLDAGDTDVTQYAWDFRNRLVEVTHRAAAGGAATQVVDYLYDVEDRWIGENIDSNGDGQFDHATRFAYDGTQIVLQFDKDVSGVPGSADALTGADRSHHYLWQPDVVDQLMADEPTHLDSGNIVTDELLWALTDQQGTVRDLARSDGATTSVVNHIVYETFGTIVSQSDSTQGTLFGFTGRPLDTATGLQNNWHRVYDSITGGWLSTDPLSFTAGDANTSRYVGNSPTNATDPSGLIVVVPGTEAANLEKYILKTLGWKRDSQTPLYVEEAGANGTIRFSIPGGTSTTSLWGKNGVNTLEKEILAAMLRNGREINDASVRGVEGEVQARKRIVETAQEVRFGFPQDAAGNTLEATFDGNFFFGVPMGPNKGFHKTKPNMVPFKAIEGGAISGKTHIGCTFAIGWSLVLGISRWARENSSVNDYKLNDPEDEVSRYPSKLVDSPNWITTVTSVPADNWIPGDWGYYVNDAFKDDKWEDGYEGHNFVYIGRGLTTLYGEDKTFSAVESEMRGWTNKKGTEHGDPKLSTFRYVPSPRVFSHL